MNAARAKKQEVLVTFSATRGCFVNNKYRKTRKACKAPSKKAYTTAVKNFRKEFPYTKVFTPWNEVNHISQPTYKKPKLAATYYKAMKAACKKCTVIAADVLDSSDVKSYLRKFQKATKSKGRIWGLHNYKDVNRKQSKGVRNVMSVTKGQVWLTETGGIVKFGKDFPRSTKRAAYAHEVHVLAGAQVQAHQADLQLPLLRRAEERPLRRRAGQPERLLAPGLQAVQEVHQGPPALDARPRINPAHPGTR